MHKTVDQWFWWQTPSGDTFWSQRHGKQRTGPTPNNTGDPPGTQLRDVAILSPSRQVSLEVDGLVRSWHLAHYATGAGTVIEVDGDGGSVTFTEVQRFPDPSLAVAAGSLTAPMPGAVVSVHVQAGDTVTSGQPLLVLEAMKMLHTIGAPADGTVAELPVTVGQNVDVGMVLAVVDAGEVRE